MNPKSQDHTTVGLFPIKDKINVCLVHSTLYLNLRRQTGMIWEVK